MRIYSWNVNGIRAITKKGFLEWVEKESPDILCLQETKAYPDQLQNNLINIDGYYSFWNNPQKKGYAGVVVYTKIKPLSVEKTFENKTFDTEGRALVLTFKDFILLNVYFPNGGMGPERLKYKLEFYEKFLKYINSLKNRKIIICGDVNTAHKEIDLARPKQNEINTGFLPVERKWIDKVIKNGFVDTFREVCEDPGRYTWWDYKTRARERNVGWRIDYFFASRQIMSRVEDSYIMSDVIGSDHCPIGIELNSE